MKKLKGLLCWALAASVAIFAGLRTASVLAQTDGCRLTLQLTNVVDVAIVDYDRVVAPIVPAAGVTSTVPVICYCGPALLLGAAGCGTNSLRVESSWDLTTWAPFPQPGFQLTLGTTSCAVIPLTGTNRFFRAAVE